MLESKFGMKYKMPHVLVHIVDNSARSAGQEVVVADDPSMYATLVVSGFPIGEDNKLIHVTRSDILNVAYGLGNITASDIKKYGQTITYPNGSGVTKTISSTSAITRRVLVMTVSFSSTATRTA